MSILHDDIVIITPPEKEGEEATIVTVNCPDKTGLGSDLCRIILFFGLTILRGGIVQSFFLVFSFSFRFLILICFFCLVESRCFNWWKMVLYCILGGGKRKNKVEFVEEETYRCLPFFFFSFCIFFLSHWFALSKASWSFSFEVLLQRS